MRSTYFFWSIILFICALILLTIKGIVTLDSDFGWHIRMGQIILQSGIPKTDPLSYTMRSYPFVDHEWLTNVIIAFLHPLFGMTGLAILFAALTGLAYFLQIPFRFNRYVALPILLILGAIFPIGGVRTQVVSWFLFSLTLFLIYNYSHKKYFLFAPLFIMVIWANLHGAFPIGLVTFGLFYITDWINQKKINIREASSLLAATLITCVNPYAARLWWEIWMQMSDSSLRFSIIEWMPAIFFVNVALWMYVVVSAMLTFRYRAHYSLFQKSMYVIFLIAGISSFRHMPLFMIVALFPTMQALDLFYQEISKYKFGKERVKKFYLILNAVALFCLVWTLGLYSMGASQNQEKKAYPKKALSFIKTHLPKGQIYAPYEWGGYLEWQLPEKKMFIDGRMPSFRRSESETIVSESSYVFKEYQKIMYGNKKEFDTIMKKYNVEMLVIPKSSTYIKSTLDTAFEKILESQKIKKTVKKARENKYENYQTVYKDEVTLIYIKK